MVVDILDSDKNNKFFINKRILFVFCQQFILELKLEMFLYIQITNKQWSYTFYYYLRYNSWILIPKYLFFYFYHWLFGFHLHQLFTSDDLDGEFERIRANIDQIPYLFQVIIQCFCSWVCKDNLQNFSKFLLFLSIAVDDSLLYLIFILIQ